MYSIIDKKTKEHWASYSTLAEASAALIEHAKIGITEIVIVHE